MSITEDLEFLFEAVSGILHGEAQGGAGELRADKFDKRWESYRQSHDELANELGHLSKRLAELEREAGVLEEEEFDREMARIEEQFPDEL